MVKDLKWSDTSIYDEIYGYIPLTDIELGIINHPLFQRLNYIRQLGNTYRVFPGAHHTRFSHSLGAMCILDKMITSRYINIVKPEERQKLRLAALLHDIGHYPFSHAVETIFTENGKIKEGKHEKFGEFVLKKYSIKELLDVYKPEEISDIFLGKSGNVLYNQLMSSELDADRMDYLFRDSIHTGVKYGRFDLDRIIHTLRISKKGFLGVHEEGVRAADGYIIGRHLMWTTVYTHKTVSGYDELLKAAFEKTIEKKFSTLDKLKKLSEEDFIKFNDNYVLNIIAKNMKSKDKYSSDICKAYFNRGHEYHLHIAVEAKEFTEEGKSSLNFYQLDDYKKKSNLERLIKRDELKGWIFHSNSKTKLPSLKPNMLEDYYKFEKEGKSGEEMIKSMYIINNEGKETMFQNYEHSLTKKLTNLSYDIVRIYTKYDYIEEVEQIIKKDLE